jgi:DNA-binding NtrC family response regulator
VSGGEESADVARVLVVDDEEVVRRAYARVLARHGFAVGVAADAEAALVELRGRRYDAVLSDVSMPGLSGIDLVKRLRAEGDDVPVVLMTGDPRILSLSGRAVEHGVTRYLSKPVESDTLVTALRAAIRLRGLDRGRRLAFDDDG